MTPEPMGQEETTGLSPVIYGGFGILVVLLPAAVAALVMVLRRGRRR